MFRCHRRHCKPLEIFTVTESRILSLQRVALWGQADVFSLRCLIYRMVRSLPAITAAAGISLTGLALYPVLARDLDGFEITDPMELVLPTEPVSAVAEPAFVAPPTPPQPPMPSGPVVISTHSGEASWYGPGLYGNRTANGEVFRPGTMTAAHRTLPFGTKVRVTNLWNGRRAVVRINDRGPFAGDRVIDLAHGAARELGLMRSGIAEVRLEVLR